MKARDAANFSQFAPVLQEWVDLLKKYATAIDSSRPIYDVLLDDYETGMTSARLDEIFSEVHRLHACHNKLEGSKYPAFRCTLTHIHTEYEQLLEFVTSAILRKIRSYWMCTV